jgi:hypothetical protein
LDPIAISHDVQGASYEESDDAQDHFYCAFLLCLWSLAALPPQLLHLRAIKLVVAPAQSPSSRMISHYLLTSFPMVEKKQGIEKHF